MELSQEQLDKLIDLLKQSKRCLRDAASPYQNLKPNYSPLASRIELALEELGLSS